MSSPRGLELNKIAAAVLLAGLIAMVVGTIVHALYFGMEHPGKEEEAKRGYTIAGAEEFEAGAAGGASASAEPAAPVDILPLLAAADAAQGEAISKKCLSCHDFSKGGPNKVGPNLYGIVGAKHAHKADFAYSDAIKGMSGSWDPQSLSEFLTAPQKYAKGTKMTFAGLKKPEERAALIKYLQTLK